MAVPYPEWMRPMLRMSKQRSQPAAFTMREPRRGAGYRQAIGTDRPVFWSCQFRFTRDESIVFRLWFKYDLAEGLEQFTLPILTEFGLVTHTCEFLPDSLLDASEVGESITYSATIMARAEVIPQGYIDASSLITGIEDWQTWAAYLDQAMNVDIPPA